ncbi:nucleotidyltransferase family protein [Ferrimonas aestuarii]|uniref:RelA/SpoT domain-containing protein n=1 Tax=Ferrimonas aestuarii TaxID=2569539 RepID=A0A4U1BUQ4_9GAMM|nr:hypothetical protein [Ferrimonas aestuarii]TKB56551.1 hypothetical protein FCL42_05310 [Ferrimonas aestuarii]
MGKFLKTALMLLMVGQSPVQAASPLSLTAASGDLPKLERQNRAAKGLPELMAISHDSSQVQQPISDFENLYAQAEQAQQELAMLTHKVAFLSGTEASVPNIKSRERAKAKVASKFNGDVTALTDLARTTIIANDVEGVVRAYQTLQQQGQIQQVKNRFQNPKANGYRDLNVLVTLPETQLVAEVQIHLSDIAAIKSGPEHKIYTDIQQIERLAEQQQRQLSEFETARIAKLKQQSTQLYQQQWAQIELAQPQQFG